MDKCLLQIFCLLNLIILIYSAENEAGNIDSRQAYDLTGSIRRSCNRLRYSLRLKELSPIHSLQFNGFGDEFVFLPSENLSRNSSKCLDDIVYLLENIENEWALKLIDSFGKPESGILQGNFKWIGDYNECTGIRATNPNSSTVGNFRGKYCSLSWSMNFLNLSIPLPFESAVCIPDSCSEEELQDDILQILCIAGVAPVLNDTKTVLKTNSLKCKPTERHLNTPAKAVIAVLSVFCALSVLGSSVTAVKYFQKIINESRRSPLSAKSFENKHGVGDETNVPKNVESDDEALLQGDKPASYSNVYLQKIENILSCFCVFTNGAKILSTDSSEGELLCIHGIRFLSMSWVILGHSYMFGILQMSNLLELPDLIQNFPFQIVLQGFYSVDSFFVLSGFLLAYLSMKEFAKTKGNIFWPYFYIHRYIRLTPIYMIILGFSATVYLYMGSGPYWPDGDLDPICRDNWWRNLIYINNFSDQSGECMGWAWYLANDMQFFVISPIFLITLWRWPKIGCSLLAAFLFASWAANFYITYHFDLIAGFSGIFSNIDMLSVPDETVITKYFNKIYIKPYTRIGPYLTGMFTGYILFKNKATNRPKHSLVFLCIGWIVASAITLTCVYGLYHSNPSVLANSFYNALNRTGFALGLSWVIYVCLIGQGGFVNRILSFKMFIPLSRLTYAAYLIHPMIITGYFSSLKTSVTFSHPTMVVLFLAFMVVTYGLSLPVALTLESPVVSLEKLVRKSFTRQQKKEAVN